MGNFLIAISVFLITVIGALFTIPYFIDWNSYRGVFEEEASKLLGREVRVGGAVNLHLLPTPYFRFEKVRIADTSVDLQEPIFRADSLTVKLTIPPLLRGAIEANEIEFERPILRLASDKKGGWNWQSFGQTFSSLAYMPTNIALTSVKINSGVFAVHGADGAERLRIDGLAGELSAPSLDGPYRFRGTYGGKGPAEREIRIGTARPEADGAVRFKASLRMGSAGSNYTLDARVVDLMGSPRIDGELTARLPTVGLWQTAQRSTSGARKGASAAASDDRSGSGAVAAAPGPAFDLKAAVQMDAAGAALSDLALAFEQDGRPQLVTGELKARWSDALAVDMMLSSRWLDLDRIAGAGENAGPLDSIVPLAVRLQDLLPAEGRSRASFSVSQANIGGEAVNGVKLVLARTGERLEIQELRLGMPGGSRGELQGAVSGPAEAPVFAGTLALRGASLVRFLAWVSGNALAGEARSDGAFGVRAQLSISPQRVAAREVVGDLSGMAITGNAHYGWSGRPELALNLDSPQLDARTFMSGNAALSEALSLLMHGTAATQGEGQAPGKAGWSGAQTDMSIRLNAGQLITAQRVYRDVMAQLEVKSGNLRIPLLRVAGDQGFTLELEGKVDNAASRPKGTLQGIVTAETGRALDPLAELLGIPAAYRLDDARADAVVPLRLAGSIAFGLRTPAATDVTVDGEANGARVKISGRLDGSPEGWRKGPADLTASIESASSGVIAALMAPRSATTQRGEAARPGRLLLRASGVPAEGLTSLASIETGEVNASFRGQLVAGESGNKITGEMEIKATDGARFAALAGLAPPLRLDDLPIAGTLSFSSSASMISIDRLALKIAGSPIKGQLALSSAGERERKRITGRLEIGETSVAKLLAPLLDQRTTITATAEAALQARQSFWPDEPFDAGVLDGFEGSLRLSTPRLALADGITMKDANLDIALESGKLEVKQLEGAAFGGRASAQVRFERMPGGAEVAGRISIEGGRLEALSAATGGIPRASGSVTGELTFAGKGTSPRNAISALQGSGSLQLGEGKIAGLWPGAINSAIDAALKAEADRLAPTLRQALVAGLSARALDLPESVKLEIGDARLQVKPFAVETPEGRAIGAALIDLRTLMLESDWRLEQNAASGPMPDKPALPAVPVFYRGSAAALAGIEPRIITEPLERELAVRKMERDVEELERLRKLDEARRRSEAERLRRQFDPQPPLPAPPTSPDARPATPG